MDRLGIYLEVAYCLYMLLLIGCARPFSESYVFALPNPLPQTHIHTHLVGANEKPSLSYTHTCMYTYTTPQHSPVGCYVCSVGSALIFNNPGQDA
ncbi:hypothetical protein F5Y10DRAFT_259560 [Nemania abortiva]|nr:hypothetical protein F5Y10DRAFT_259560 [Nemania abortiva]